MTDFDRTPASELGRAIQMRRIELGMKRKDLALASGLSYAYVSEIENGTKEPSMKALMNLAHTLSLPSDQLLELAGRLGGGYDRSVLVSPASPERSEARLYDTSRAAMRAAPPPRDWNQMEHRVEEIVRKTIQSELRFWAESELPRLLRRELRLLLARTDEGSSEID